MTEAQQQEQEINTLEFNTWPEEVCKDWLM